MKTKDVKRLWESVGSFWDRFENKDVIENLWQGYLEISEHVTMRNFGVRLSKSMKYMPSLIEERFGTFNIVFTGLNTEDINVYKDPAGNYLLKTHYSHIAGMPYLKNLNVSSEADYTENSQFSITNFNSLNLKKDQIKCDPANSGLVDYVELHADKFYRYNPVLWEVWGKSVGLDLQSISQKKYKTFRKSIDTMDSTEALKLNANHYKHIIWGLSTFQSQGATLKNLKGAANITAGLPFAYNDGDCTAITTASGYNFVTVTGIDGNYTYDIPSHLTVNTTVGSSVNKFQPLTQGIAIYDYVNNIDEVKVFTDYPGNGTAKNWHFNDTLVKSSKANVTFDRDEVTLPVYSYEPYTAGGADKTRVSTNSTHTLKAGYTLSIAGAATGSYNSSWVIENPVYDDNAAGHNFIIDTPFVAGSDHHGGTLTYNSGAYSGVHLYYGDEALINGNFQSNSNWSISQGWAINGNLQVLQASGIHPANSVGQSNVTDFSGSGSEYWVRYTVKNRVSGNVWVSMGTNNGVTRSSDGTYTEVLEAKGNANFYIKCDADFQGYIDDVSVRKVKDIGPSGATNGELEGDFYPILNGGQMELNDTTAYTRNGDGKAQSLKIYDTALAGIATQTGFNMTKGSHYRFRGSFYNNSSEYLHTELSVAKKGIEQIKRGYFSRGVGADQTDWVKFDGGTSSTFTVSMVNGLLNLVNTANESSTDYLMQNNVATMKQGKSYVLRIGVESFEGASWFYNHNGSTNSFGNTQNTDDNIVEYFDWDENYNLEFRIGVNSGTLKISSVSIKEMGQGYSPTAGLPQSHFQEYLTGVKNQIEPYNLNLKPKEWVDLDLNFNYEGETDSDYELRLELPKYKHYRELYLDDFKFEEIGFQHWGETKTSDARVSPAGSSTSKSCQLFLSSGINEVAMIAQSGILNSGLNYRIDVDGYLSDNYLENGNFDQWEWTFYSGMLSDVFAPTNWGFYKSGGGNVERIIQNVNTTGGSAVKITGDAVGSNLTFMWSATQIPVKAGQKIKFSIAYKGDQGGEFFRLRIKDSNGKFLKPIDSSWGTWSSSHEYQFNNIPNTWTTYENTFTVDNSATYIRVDHIGPEQGTASTFYIDDIVLTGDEDTNHLKIELGPNAAGQYNTQYITLTNAQKEHILYNIVASGVDFRISANHAYKNLVLNSVKVIPNNPQGLYNRAGHIVINKFPTVTGLAYDETYYKSFTQGLFSDAYKIHHISK